MKNFYRTLVAALLVVLMAGSANAQIRFGLRAGINVDKLNVSHPSFNFSEESRCGFTGGVMTEITVPVIGINFDVALLYARMNSQTSITVEDGTLLKSDNKNFFQIPVYLKYKFQLPVVSRFLAPYLYTGPTFAFRLGGDNDVFKTKTFQCGWDLGLGIELLHHLQIGAGYSWGINNIVDKTTGIHTSDDFKIRNNYWTITAAYIF